MGTAASAATVGEVDDGSARLRRFNASIRYVLYAVFATDAPLPFDDERCALVAETAALLEGYGTAGTGPFVPGPPIGTS